MASFACGTRDEPYIPRRRADASVLKRGLSWRHLLNIYKLKATSCGLFCIRKPCPRILVWNGMQFPLGSRLGKCVPLFSWIPGCIFRLRLVGKVRPGLGANCGMQFPLAESPLNRKPGWPVFGYPGFWIVDMFDWLLVGLAALDQHDEGHHYERCSRCCCGGD